MLDKKHSVGKTIASLRKAKGLTQVELTEKLQVSDKAVSKWEKDDSFPSIEFFPALAELFNVSIDYLITGKAPEKNYFTLQCFRHSADKSIEERASYSNEQKSFLIDYGLVIIKAIHDILQMRHV